LAQARAALGAAGIPADVLDVAVHAPRAEQLRDAKLIAVAVPMHTALRLGVDMVRATRQLGSRATVCFFGLYAPLNADYLFDIGADAVMGPEFSDALAQVARACLNSTAPEDIARALHGMPGIWTRQQSWPLLPPRPPVTRIDRRGLPTLHEYAALEHHGVRTPVGYVEASRGCKHTCLHCPITPVYQGRFFAVEQKTVLTDISELVSYGAGHITFGDPDFFNGPTHALRLVRALHQRHPHVTWDATIKVEHILKHQDLLPELRAQGGLFVVSAVESTSDDVLQRLRKGHTRADIKYALHATRAAGLVLRPTFVAFTPWTTAHDYLDMLDLIDDEEWWDCVDPVQLAIRLLIPPGSALLDQIRGEPWLGPLNPSRLCHTWTHPDPGMDALTHELTALVAERAAETAEPTETLVDAMTLARQRLLAAPHARTRPFRHGSPRLTEHWFC
jgi:radical SAM superfamily enzyme YgiQ (UPF0313 family)